MDTRKEKMIWRGIYVVLALFIVIGIYKIGSSPKPGEQLVDLGNAHIESESSSHEPYNTKPPTSGAHIGSRIAPWGVHTEQIPDELQVHNLEDGGVLIQYDCERLTEKEKYCSVLASELAGIGRSYKKGVIVAPYAGLSKTIALTAWTRLELFDPEVSPEGMKVDLQRIQDFIKTYQGIDHHVK